MTSTLALTGAPNFRDLAGDTGYRGAGGRALRRHRVFRSDHLGQLSQDDLKRLAAGPGTRFRVLDLRGVNERTTAACSLPAAEVHSLPIEPTIVQKLTDLLDAGARLTEADTVALMQDTYRGFVRGNTPRFAELFAHVLDAQADSPIVFHCTAGKDRTGFAAAILLRLLGVPHETVIQDYLLTNEYFFAHYKWNLVLARLMKGGRFADAIRGFMRAEPQYLSTAFDTMDREFGSFERYIRDGIGLSPTEVEHLRTTYLE